MSDPVTISLKAVVVNGNERAAVSIAATLLENNLSVAAGEPFAVQCQFEASLDALKGSGEACVIIASLLTEVANHQKSWTEVESRLRESYRELTSTDGAVVFLCTVFRHVASGESADQSRLIRIRRLNLLAAELSRETGLFVIDLDRALADIGAIKLQTDYRLDGKHAADAVAKIIALAVVSAGLDSYASFDVQDAAKLKIGDGQLSLATPDGISPDIMPSNVLSLGTGRRKQVVATVVDTNSESHASWLVHLMFTGQFGVKDAVAKLSRSIARRGLRSSSAIVLTAIWQAVRGRARRGR
jgi:hypothetical protein